MMTVHRDHTAFEFYEPKEPERMSNTNKFSCYPEDSGSLVLANRLEFAVNLSQVFQTRNHMNVT